MAGEDDDGSTLRSRARSGDAPPAADARPAPRDTPDAPRPGEANPTSDPEGRPLDRRTRSP